MNAMLMTLTSATRVRHSLLLVFPIDPDSLSRTGHYSDTIDAPDNLYEG
jgi:hypothetical protein